MESKVVYNQDVEKEVTGPGCQRKVLAWDKKMMAVECYFEKGATPAVHTHPHSQTSYVISGRYRFMVEGQPVEVGPGDTLCFAPDAPHGLECLEAGVVLDVFAPYRETFVKE